MKNRTFLTVNFGCRVNAAEINQLAQIYIDHGYLPYIKNNDNSPDLIIINTCSVTKKGDIESLSRIRKLSQKYPTAKIIATGCARLEKIKNLPNVTILTNDKKNLLSTTYTPKIKDKFSHTHRYLLKVQTGCTQMCTYCIVPYRRSKLWSLSIKDAVSTVKKAVENGYTEVIITGVNLEQYQYGFSNLIEALLQNTDIKLISFGSVPLNCLDTKFITLLKNFEFRISNFLHIPIQSGSDKILSAMHRPYTRIKILKTIRNLKLEIRNLQLGTDIIIGFPGETDIDFQQTLDLCQNIGFKKIHPFKFSPRPGTAARIIWQKSKIDSQIIKKRQILLNQIRQ